MYVLALHSGRSTGDLNALFSVVFSLCMSHVVGEVTYVELFKDGEGKSRVSVGESARLKSHSGRADYTVVPLTFGMDGVLMLQ